MCIPADLTISENFTRIAVTNSLMLIQCLTSDSIHDHFYPRSLEVTIRHWVRVTFSPSQKKGHKLASKLIFSEKVALSFRECTGFLDDEPNLWLGFHWLDITEDWNKKRCLLKGYKTYKPIPFMYGIFTYICLISMPWCSKWEMFSSTKIDPFHKQITGDEGFLFSLIINTADFATGWWNELGWWNFATSSADGMRFLSEVFGTEIHQFSSMRKNRKWLSLVGGHVIISKGHKELPGKCILGQHKLNLIGIHQFIC